MSTYVVKLISQLKYFKTYFSPIFSSTIPHTSNVHTFSFIFRECNLKGKEPVDEIRFVTSVVDIQDIESFRRFLAVHIILNIATHRWSYIVYLEKQKNHVRKTNRKLIACHICLSWFGCFDCFSFGDLVMA